MYKYAYLLGSVLFFVLWIPIFILRKDLRHQMLFMSVIAAVLGLYFEYYIWTVDWWQPETITGTRAGLEDLALGFTNGGLGAVLYEFLFKKRTRALKKTSHLHDLFKNHKWLLALPVICAYLVDVFVFWGLGIHSFWSTLLASAVGVTLIIIFRHDLFLDALYGGVALTLVSLPVYFILIILFPEFIQRFWLLENISGILILKIPIEDLIFYFCAGAFIAPLYEYIFEKELVKITKKS